MPSPEDKLNESVASAKEFAATQTRRASATIEKYGGELKADPAKRVKHAWVVVLVFIATVVVCAVAASVYLETDDEGASAGAAFAAIWTAFMVLGLAVGGSLILHRNRTQMMFGFFLGAAGMVSQMMFMNFAIFAGLANAREGDKAANRAMAAFCFLLWLALSGFAGLLVYDRQSLLEAAELEAPPALEKAEESGLA